MVCCDLAALEFGDELGQSTLGVPLSAGHGPANPAHLAALPAGICADTPATVPARSIVPRIVRSSLVPDR